MKTEQIESIIETLKQFRTELLCIHESEKGWDTLDIRTDIDESIEILEEELFRIKYISIGALIEKCEYLEKAIDQIEHDWKEKCIEADMMRLHYEKLKDIYEEEIS